MSQSLNSAIAVIGIDIGKNSFHVVGLDDRGAIVLRQKWSRGQIEVRLANMPPCLIGMEACVGAHHLSRKLQAFGHDARLMPGKYGNPLACAVARVALQVLIEEGMVENARAMGARFLAGLRQISSPAVKEVRGRGLMIAVELHPQAGGARRYCDALRLRGVLCKDTHDHTIRVSPPLVITRDEIDWALDQFDAALLHPETARAIRRHWPGSERSRRRCAGKVPQRHRRAISITSLSARSRRLKISDTVLNLLLRAGATLKYCGART